MVEEAERGTRFVADVAAGGLHSALLSEHAHATGGLRFEVGPYRRANATGDHELALGGRDEPHERVDPITELAVPGVERAQVIGARGMAFEHRGVGGRVDVE